MRRHRLLVLGFIMLSACGTRMQNNSATAIDVLPRQIVYQTWGCYGTCPVYRLTVRADGSGRFEGQADTTVNGTRDFQLTPVQYRAFADFAAPLRPASGSRRLATPEECGDEYWNHNPYAELIWTGEDGSEQRFLYYFGCIGYSATEDGPAGRNRNIWSRMDAAPRQLPPEIVGWIGEGAEGVRGDRFRDPPWTSPLLPIESPPALSEQLNASRTQD